VGLEGLGPLLALAALLAIAVTLGRARLRHRRPGRAEQVPFGAYLAGATWLVFLAQLTARG
jgi:prepilin signal peptidase PulO-like enzyme (type II secretory pathway)